MSNQVSDQARSWQNLMQISFKVEEWNVSIRIRLIGQPIAYEHGDDSYVLIGGLMLEGCPSTSGQHQSVNPPHNGWWCWDCLMQLYKFSIRLKSEFLLGHAIQDFHGARRSRLLVFAVCDVHSPIVHEHGLSCSGWLSRCGTAWVSRTSLKFHQAVMIALDLDQWQFSIMGKEPQYHDGSVSTGISSLERLKGTPSGFAL